MKKISTILCTLALLFGVLGGVNSVKAGEDSSPILLNEGNSEGVTIVPYGTSTSELLYAATFTPTADLQNVFQYKDMPVGDWQKIVVKFAEPVPSGWNIHAYGGQSNFFSLEGLTEYEITLNGSNVDDFTIFNWFGIRSSITVTECYFYKEIPETRDVYALGTPITFAEALVSSEPFVVVQDGKVLCGPLSSSDASLTFKEVSEIDNYSWTIAFEEDSDNEGSYFMNLKDKNGTSKGYINASVWSHTYLSGVDKSNSKGECQDGALWTVTDLGNGKYSIRNLGVAEGYYNNKPGGNTDDRAALGQGYLAITPNGYWANHVTHYNTSGEWQFYTLAITQLPANDHLFFGWDDLIVTSDENVTKDDKTHLVVDKRGYAPYWAETAKWNLGSFDASNYRYLVFYAKRNVCKYGNEDNETGGTLFIKDANGVTFRQDDLVKYKNSEEVEKNYPEDHIGKLWMNRWNEQRATVLDLQWLANTDKYGDGSECKVLDITKIKEIGVAGTFTIGGIFFTNTQPLYSAGDYTRTFDSFDKYGTICLPFSAVCCGAQLYEIVGKSSDGIALAEYEGVMEAGKPYFYKSLEAIKQDNGLVDETKVYFFKAGYEQVNAPVENNGLIGTFSEITAPEGSDKYVLSSNKLYDLEGATSVKVGANKAYVDASKISDAAGVRAAFISFFEDETGINTVQENPIVKSEAIYNLAGQRVNKAQKGIFIINGKKVVR